MAFREEALKAIIQDYTREAGVRTLERQIAAVCRKIARKVVQGDVKRKVQVTRKQLTDYLGVPRFTDSEVMTQDTVGVATGLACPRPWPLPIGLCPDPCGLALGLLPPSPWSPSVCEYS